MTEREMYDFLILLIRLVHDDRPWQAKRDELLAASSDEEKTAIEEFASWFGETAE